MGQVVQLLLGHKSLSLIFYLPTDKYTVLKLADAFTFSIAAA